MKISEIVVGKEYAVVPSWTYGGKNARDITKTRENDVVKATLVSKDKYVYEPSDRKESKDQFALAKSGERSVGVLVSAKDSNNKEFFWTTRLADIVALYEVLEPIWKERNEQARLEMEIESIRRKQIHDFTKQVEDRVEISRNSIIATTKELLGENVFVKVDTEGYELKKKAVVSISLDEYERLIEMSYAGKGQ